MRVLVATCAALILALGLVIWQRDSARKDAEEWKLAADAAITSMREAKAAKVRADIALTEHRAKVDELNRQSQATRRKLAEVSRDDKAAKDWGATIVPDGIVRLLHQNGDKNCVPDAAAASADADA